jgi:hypothetical protein
MKKDNNFGDIMIANMFETILTWKDIFTLNHSLCFKLLDYKSLLTKSMVPEPEGPSPYLQEPATGPYPESTGSTLHSPSQCC